MSLVNSVSLVNAVRRPAMSGTDGLDPVPISARRKRTGVPSTTARSVPVKVSEPAST